MLLRTLASSVQVRAMEKMDLTHKGALSGRVFRNEAIQPAHTIFHQVGAYIDKGVSFADLKQRFCSLPARCSAETEIRLRPPISHSQAFC